MKRLGTFGVLCASLIVLSGGGSREHFLQALGPRPQRPSLAHHEATRMSMACLYAIDAYGPDAAALPRIVDEAFDEVDRIDRLMSHYQSASELSRVNRDAARAPVTVDPELFDFIAEAMRYSRESDGAFDITVGPLMKAWRFFRGEGGLPSDRELAAARQHVGAAHVRLDRAASTIGFDEPGVELDLGGIAKGYAVDRVVDLLRRKGVSAALVSAGGSTIYGLGAPPGRDGWAVALQDPIDARKTALTVTLKDRALSVAGASEKSFEADGVRYSHIMDPRSGSPAQGMLTVAVLTATGTAGDALDDAFFVLGEEKSRSYLNRLAGTEALFFVPAANGGWSLVRDESPQASYRPSAANLAAREWFQDARFGLFVHWGVYSVLGDGEWVMNNRRIPIEDYEKLPQLFNPTAFDAAEWVALAKAAGMKYITITSKHHDGFAMFDSRVSDYDIVDRTPYKKDVMKALAEECRKQGLKLFFYYSQLDWHHPDYFPRGRTGRDAGRPEQGEWSRYIDYMNSQLRELLTNYGDIGGIWFDGWWDRPEAEWRLESTYSLIHQLQPQALIGANHHRRPFPGEDFQMFEKDLPGGRTADFNKDSEIGDLPLETAETINGAWGFNITDRRYKSTRDLIRYLVRAAGANANFLLNIGPMPNGRIQPEFVTRLRDVGAWLAKNGESIYGTRGGPIKAQPWGVTTRKGNRIYVHVLDAPERALLLPPIGMRVRSAQFLSAGRRAEIDQRDIGVIVTLPAEAIDPIDTIIVLELDAR